MPGVAAVVVEPARRQSSRTPPYQSLSAVSHCDSAAGNVGTAENASSSSVLRHRRQLDLAKKKGYR